MDDHDVGVADSREDTRLALEAHQSSGVLRPRQDLDRALDGQLGVARAVDRAHAPAAEGVDDYVVIERQVHRLSMTWPPGSR